MLRSIQARRIRRSRAVGLKVSLLGIPICLLAAWIDHQWGTAYSMYGDLATALGCALSYLITRARGSEKPFFWPPAYFAFVVGAYLTIQSTGGLFSPFLPPTLMLLIVAGIGLQARFSIGAVFSFAVAVFLSWATITAAYGIAPYDPFPFYPFVAKTLAYLGGIYICIRSLLLTEEKLADETEQQNQQLSETRENLIHAAKLAELGNLIASTAHELAQPAQVIAGLTALTERKLSRGGLSDGDLEKFLWRTRDASDRIIALLRDLRDFSRKDSFKAEPIDLRLPVSSVHKMMRNDFMTCKVSFDLAAPQLPLVVEGDPMRLQQILLNLINNARDAAMMSSKREVSVKIESHLGRWARVHIRNTGPAIPLEAQHKLFQDYFTTKAKGRGTGLGLSICAQLTEAHKGRLFFSSEDENTSFVLDLPLAAAATLVATNPIATA